MLLHVNVILCELQLYERSIHDSLVNIPPHITKSDFHASIFAVLSCLVSFHFLLDKIRQVTSLYFSTRHSNSSPVCTGPYSVLQCFVVYRCNSPGKGHCGACGEVCCVCHGKIVAIIVKLSELTGSSMRTMPLNAFGGITLQWGEI